MTARQDLIAASLFKQVPEGFVYRKPKLWPPAEFYLLNQRQRDEILAATVPRKPWRMIVIFTFVLLSIMAVPTKIYIAWAPVASPSYSLALLAGIVLATIAAAHLHIRRIQYRIEPILARAQPTDQTITRADLRMAVAKVSSFQQFWWTAVAVGAFSLFQLAAFVWDRNYAREAFASYLPLLPVALFAIWAAFIMRAAYEKIGNTPSSASGTTSLFVTRPRTLAWSSVTVWLAAFVTMSVIGALYEFSDLTKGLRLQAAGDTNGAIARFTKAQAVDPASPAVYIARAAAFNVGGNLDGALADLTKAIELQPGRALSYRDRALILSEKKEWSRAIADYDMAISIDPNDAYAYFFRGTVHKSNKDLERAIADFTKTLEINPEDRHAYLHRGWTYQAKSDHDRAIADFDRAIAIAPKYILPIIARGVSLQAKKDYAGAVASFSDAVSIDPSSSRAYYHRAEVHYATKAVELALTDYRTLLNLPALTDADRTYQAMATRRIILLTTPGGVPLTNPK